MQKKEVAVVTANVSQCPRQCRLRQGALLLVGAGMFFVPGMVLMGGVTPLLELVPYQNPLELPVRVVLLFALSWKWIWTEGTPLQILLTVLLLFCGVWACCLLRAGRHRGRTAPKEDGVC